MMGLNKKSGEKYFEKDPFLVPISNNNTTYVQCYEEKQRLPCPGLLLSSGSLLSPSLHSLSLLSGLSLILVGLVCFTVSPQLEEALVTLVQSWTALVSGPMLSAWLTPPILPLLRIYVFNITNPQEVLEGQDPVTEELGPYVYSATHLRRIVEVKSNVLLPLLSSLGRPEPILSVTVGGFLFGYQDDLACLGSKVSNNDEAIDIIDDESDDGWDNWDDEEEDVFFRRKRSPNYTDSSGQCLWGILKDLNNTEHETVRIMTGKTDFRSKGKILDIDGRTAFGAWTENSGCDQISGSLEPSSLPAGLQERFSLMLPVMCRKIDMVAVEDYTIQDIPVTRYEAEENSLEEDPCYCPHSTCLPSGYLSLESCHPDVSPPIAVSFPHGLHSPSNPLLTHTPTPDYNKHSLHIDINNQLGVPLVVQVNFQLSAILRPDPSFPILNKINRTRLVPLFWASEGFDSPSDWMVSQTKLALRLPIALSLGGAGALMGIGLLLVILWVWRRH